MDRKVNALKLKNQSTEKYKSGTNPAFVFSSPENRQQDTKKTRSRQLQNL